MEKKGEHEMQTAMVDKFIGLRVARLKVALLGFLKERTTASQVLHWEGLGLWVLELGLRVLGFCV